MTERSYRIERPPLSRVDVGDEIWIPAFCEDGVSPGWMLVQSVGEVEDREQRVKGIRVTAPFGDVEVTLPLARTSRRVNA